MKKTTQRYWVEEQLEKYGEVTRNGALRVYISRLGAIICEMKKRGWVFNTTTRETIKPDGSKGKDFVYLLVKKP
jgi:hypothetical protein